MFLVFQRNVVPRGGGVVEWGGGEGDGVEGGGVEGGGVE